MKYFLVFLLVALGLGVGLLLGSGYDFNSLLNPQAAVATGVAQTQQVSQLQTAAAGGGQAQGFGESIGTGDADQQPPSTPDPGAPMVSVSVDTHCRRGPNVSYAHVVTILIGQQVEVLQVFPGADYVVIKNPNGAGDCWLWLRYANQTDFSAHNLPLATEPPTPVPSSTATVANTATAAAPAFNWGGSWAARWEVPGGIQMGALTCSVNGNALNCSSTFPDGFGNFFVYTGTISADTQTVSGVMSTSNINTNWQAQIRADSPNQFRGTLGGGAFQVLPFCGWRTGGSPPVPCNWP